MSVVVRRAQPADVSAIVALMRLGLGLGTQERSAEVWRWKHEANPFGTSPVLVADGGDGLVAMRAFLRWDLVDEGGAVKAVRAVDTVTHPAHQGRGLFKKLTLQLCKELADDGVDVVFNTPNAKSGAGYLKMGWRDLGRITVWTCWSGWRRRRSSALSAALLRDVSLPVALVDRRLHTPVSRPFLVWRYADAPGLDYRVVADGTALAIGRRRRRGRFWEAMICEVLHQGDRRSVAAAARCVGDLVGALDADYAVAVCPWASRTSLALVGAGFVPLPRVGPRFVARPLTSRVPNRDFRQRAAWGLQLGDLELF